MGCRRELEQHSRLFPALFSGDKVGSFACKPCDFTRTGTCTCIKTLQVDKALTVLQLKNKLENLIHFQPAEELYSPYASEGEAVAGPVEGIVEIMFLPEAHEIKVFICY